jgi:hypothetical protein
MESGHRFNLLLNRNRKADAKHLPKKRKIDTAVIPLNKKTQLLPAIYLKWVAN